MKYTIGNFTLDTTERTLSADNDLRPIRPKTLELLLFLAERRDDVVSKEELLRALWPNVTVDEGVVFQSITEIRKLFANPKIIINFPKRGYQFTEPLIPLIPPRRTDSNSNRRKLLPLVVLFMSVVLISLTVFFSTNDVTTKYDERILVLPVVSHVAYSDANWAGLNGMENIASRLQNDESTFVYRSYEVSNLMHQVGFTNVQSKEQSGQIGKLTGASLVVETNVYGGINNYNLVYRFHANNQVIEGSVFDTAIDGAFAKLVDKISDFSAVRINNTPQDATAEFNDALFAKAVISYESDWKTSISFFETYLNLNPESVIARIYLARLYLWEQKTNLAAVTIRKATEIPTTDRRHLALIDFIQGQLAAANANWTLAEQHYSEALRTLASSSDWSLKGDILQHRARSFENQRQLYKAQQSLETALEYYQLIESPIGINAIRLHLSRTLLKQGDVQNATTYFLAAKRAIQEKQLDFLDTLLAEHQANMPN